MNAALGSSIGLGFCWNWGDEISKGLDHEFSRIHFWWKSLVVHVGMKRYSDQIPCAYGGFFLYLGLA